MGFFNRQVRLASSRGADGMALYSAGTGRPRSFLCLGGFWMDSWKASSRFREGFSVLFLCAS